MTFSVSTGVLGQLIGSLLQEADNVVEQAVFKKIEELGKETIKDLIMSTPLGAGIRAVESFQALMGGGRSDFKKARDQWLNSLIEPSRTSSGTGSRLSKKIQKAFDEAAARPDRPDKSGHWKWSKSRQDWLNEDWKHDWRSQPRDLAGRWVKGRLNYIYVPRGRASKSVRSARRRYAKKIINLKMIKYENSF